MNDRATRLALILKAIDDLDRQFAEQKTEYKDSRTRLENQAFDLRSNILSGQLELIPEEPKAS